VITAAVIDASVALKWVLPEPDSAQALNLHQATLYAPDFILPEAANALWSAVRRSLLSADDALTRFRALVAAPIALRATGTLSGEAMALGLRTNHPVYDCLYLALALELDLKVITADQRFFAAVGRHPPLASRIIALADLT
jgi:predicted nucleic acid-binding protein